MKAHEKRRPIVMRALLTRPRAEAAELARALAARGIEALIEPLLDIEYRDGPPPDLAGVQAILCTSGNGVRALARFSDERAVPLFAVGAATAAQARTAGFTQIASADGSVSDLARLVCARLDPAAGRLLHVAGSVVAGDLAGTLRGAGFAVDRTVLYEARAATALGPECVEALCAGSIDIALFFSPRTAALFVRLAEQAKVVGRLGSVSALSISAAADAALDTLHFRERLIAARPDQTSLLAALDRLVGARQPV